MSAPIFSDPRFDQLILRAQHQALHRPMLYRIRILLWAGLGWLAVLAMLLLGLYCALSVLWDLLTVLLSDTHLAQKLGLSACVRSMIAIGLGAAFFMSARAQKMQAASVDDDVQTLQDEQAPRFFKALTRLNKKTKCPPIQQVCLDHTLALDVTMQPDYGIVGMLFQQGAWHMRVGFAFIDEYEHTSWVSNVGTNHGADSCTHVVETSIKSALAKMVGTAQ